QRQRPSHAVGQVCQPNQHVQIDNLLVGKMFLEFREIRVAGAGGGARKLFGIAERDLLGCSKSGVVPLLESLHLLRCESDAFGALDVMLRAVMASVDQRDSQIHGLVYLAVERTSHAGIESQEAAEHGGTVRQCFLDVPRLAFQLAIVNLFHFRAGLHGFNQTYPCHAFSFKCRSIINAGAPDFDSLAMSTICNKALDADSLDEWRSVLLAGYGLRKLTGKEFDKSPHHRCWPGGIGSGVAVCPSWRRC